MSGSAGLFNKKKFFFYLVGSPKVGGAGDGKHKKKYGHPNTFGSHHCGCFGTHSKQYSNLIHCIKIISE